MMRAFVRRRDGAPVEPLDVDAAFREALTHGDVEFHDVGFGAEPSLVFRLRPHGSVILVACPKGRHLGTFADPMAAVWHGFEVTDREAAQHAPAPPRRARHSPSTTQPEKSAL